MKSILIRIAFCFSILLFGLVYKVLETIVYIFLFVIITPMRVFGIDKSHALQTVKLGYFKLMKEFISGQYGSTLEVFEEYFG